MTTDTFRPCDSHTIKAQLGMGAALFISGGRITHRDTGITLPVGSGYSVTIDLGWDDLYVIRRVFKRGSKTWIKGERTGVFFEDMPEVAIRASSFQSYDADQW